MSTRIVEWQVPFSWGTGIEITAQKVINVLLRDTNNLIHVNGDNELYCDLQLAKGIAPTDDFPAGVTVWKVLASDWRPQNWLALHWQTISGDYARWLYGANGEIYFDGGAGTWSQVYYASEVDDLFTTLRSELANVAFSGDYNDLINRPSVIQLQADWNQTDTDSPDYIKNKPTNLSDFTNDLSLSDFPDDLSYADYMVSPQEYEDLPDSKNSDGKIYLIHD